MTLFIEPGGTMTSFLNRERYVRVEDMNLGRHEKGAYTDFEGLGMREDDPEWFEWLKQQVSTLVFNSMYDYKTKEWTQQILDTCDVVFYSSVHVLSAWQECDETITRDMVQLVVESTHHMVRDVLGCDWVMRLGEDWSDHYIQSTTHPIG